MNFDPFWLKKKYITVNETEEHWQVRQKFLIAHKDKFPEDLLVCLSKVFFSVKVLGCKYPQQTMDIIKSLSDDLADDSIQMQESKLPHTFLTASSAVKTEENCQALMPLCNNEMPVQNVKCTSPYDPQYILPGFMLYLKHTDGINEIITRSCTFSKCSKAFTLNKQNANSVNANLFIQNKLIASGLGDSRKTAKRDALQKAYNYLKTCCFTIKEKEEFLNSVNKNDLLELKVNSIDNLNFFNSLSIDDNEKKNNIKNYCTLPDDNIGTKMLKNMGWKAGTGLGKNEQGRTEPVEVVQLPKNLGLGNTKGLKGKSAKKKKIMSDMEREVNKQLKEFINGPKQKLIFSTEVTKEDRESINLNCRKFGLKSKSYGSGDSRKMVITKKQSAQDIFEELIHSVNHENDYYSLLPPNSGSGKFL